MSGQPCPANLVSFWKAIASGEGQGQEPDHCDAGGPSLQLEGPAPSRVRGHDLSPSHCLPGGRGVGRRASLGLKTFAWEAVLPVASG